MRHGGELASQAPLPWTLADGPNAGGISSAERVLIVMDVLTGRKSFQTWNENVRYVIQLIVFLILGTFVALIFTSPTNPRQAFAAGLGCTSAYESDDFLAR